MIELQSAPTEIVFVGSGISLDYASSPELARRPGRIVIALNLSSAYVPADFVVLTDRIALENWGKHVPGDAAAVAPRGMLNRYGIRELWPGVQWLPAEDYAPGYYSNARTCALGWAAQLLRENPGVTRFAYIGLDSGSVTAGGVEYRYASKLASWALDARHRRMFYPGHCAGRHVFRLASPYTVWPALAPFWSEFASRVNFSCLSFVAWPDFRLNLSLPRRDGGKELLWAK